MLTPAVLFALFLVFLGLTWTLSLAESAFSYLSRRDAEDIVREQPGSKVLEIARERESHLGALRVWRFVAEALSVPTADLRLFGKPEVDGQRRMGVALARDESIDAARAKATRSAQAVNVEL